MYQIIAVDDLPTVLASIKCRYDYPGNVRELKSIIERYILTGELGVKPFGRVRSIEKGEIEDILPLAEYERRYVARVYNLCGRNAKKAAELLGIAEKTVRKKLKEYEALCAGKVARIHPS